MKKLIYTAIIIAVQHSTLGIQTLFAQAPINTPDNIGAGNGLSFDGTNDFVGDIGTLSSYSFIQNTGIFTIETWIAPADIVTNTYHVIFANTTTSNHRGFSFYFDNGSGNKQIRMAIFKASLGNPVIASASPANVINDNDWHHVAAVGNGTNITFYIDGIAYAGTGSMGAFSSGNSTQLARIGHDLWAPGGYFNGQIDEVRVWNTARTQTQIRDNMCSLLQGNEVGLVGYWNMNEGTGNTVGDLTSNNNDGTRQ